MAVDGGEPRFFEINQQRRRRLYENYVQPRDPSQSRFDPAANLTGTSVVLPDYRAGAFVSVDAEGRAVVRLDGDMDVAVPVGQLRLALRLSDMSLLRIPSSGSNGISLMFCHPSLRRKRAPTTLPVS